VTTTTILLIRHGLTDWNLERRWQGHYDMPLNAEGREQARRLARRLTGWPIAAIYSSDLARAADTARVLGDGLGIEPVLDPVWRELHVGLFEGHTREEIREHFPEAWEQMSQGFVEAPEGETVGELARRVVPCFEHLVAEHAGEMFAIVSHGATLRSILGHVLGTGSDHLPRVTLAGNTGISIVEAQPPLPPVITRLNDTAHLEIEGGCWEVSR
jgi:broad specificity phosphatase PhoE